MDFKISRTLWHFCLCFAILASSNLNNKLQAQLSGTYFISDTSSYKSFKQAASDLQALGVSDAVIFKVLPGIYNERIELKGIPGTSEINQVSFESYDGDSSGVILTDSCFIDSNYIVFITEACSWVNFKGITLRSLGTIYGRVVHLGTPPQHISFSNCVFTGIYSSPGSGYSERTLVYSSSSYMDYLSFENNLFEYGSTALYLHGNNNGTGYIQGISIRNNIMKGLGYQGILLHNPVYPEISNNTIQSYEAGIDIGVCYISARIINNKIYAGDYGIDFGAATVLSPPALIANNFIYMGESSNYGLHISGGNGSYDIFHNTIITNEDYFINYGFFLGGSYGFPRFRVKNNIVACRNDGVPIYIQSPSDIAELDYNCYYTAGNFMAWIMFEPLIFSLEDFQSKTGFDTHSYVAYPDFVSDTNLHARTAWFDGKGTPVAEVTLDIDGDPRDGSSPDIGADEFTPDPGVLPPYSGSYSIGSGGHFPDLDDAVENLKLKGVSAPVSLEFLDGEYPIKSRIPSFPGASSTNTITLTSQSQDASKVTLVHDNPDENNNYILWIDGADFLTIKDLGFEADIDITYGRSIVFKGGSESLKIQDNKFKSSFNTNALTHLTQLYSAENYYRDFVISGNVFDSCAYGLYFAFSKAEWESPSGIQLEGNSFSNIGYSGIFLQRTNSPVITKNNISAKSKGIDLSRCNNELQITNNTIIAENGEGLSISISVASEEEMGLIANNMISMTGTNKAKGIYFQSSDYHNVLHNSVNIMSPLITAIAFYSNYSDHLSIYNNIFNNSGGGYAFQTVSGLIDSSDYNDLHSAGSNLANIGGTIYADLESLKTGTGNETHSLSVDPVFVSNSDLHLNSTSVVAHARPLKEVNTDIDGENRNPYTPDIGADEFAPSDNYPPILVSPVPDLYFPEDTGIVLAVLLNNIFTDPNPGDTLEFQATGDNPEIMLSLAHDSLMLNPISNYYGSVEIILSATDNAGLVARDTFITVFYNVNDPPVAISDSAIVQQDSSVRIFVLYNDYDIDGDELRVQSYVEGDHGDVMLAFGSNSMVYIPDIGFTGEDSIRYVLTDQKGEYDSATVFITVSPDETEPGFEQILVNFDSVAFGNAIWGDIDNDSDYDILVCGEKSDGSKVTSVYFNNEGVFEKSNKQLEGVSPKNDQSIAFTDLDTDGHLDVIITGEDNSGNAFTGVYIYESGLGYIEYKTDLPGVMEGSVDWGDYDRDGDPDLLLSGRMDDGNYHCKIYRNKGESGPLKWEFQAVFTDFILLKESTAKFVDFNQDDYLDVITTGIDPNHDIVGYYYTNDKGMYGLGKMGKSCNGSIAYADFDADGKVEVLTTGDTSFFGIDPATRLWEFDETGITEIATDLENVYLSSADWGDYDHDGDYDLILCGKNDQLANVTILYKNYNGTLVNSGKQFPGMAQGTVNWGDYDSDGDLDLLMSGYISSSPNRITAIYRNNSEVLNQAPASTSSIDIKEDKNQVTISWSEAVDNETPSRSLTYNIWLQRKKSYKPVLHPLTDKDGYLKISGYGNAFNNSVIINGLEEGALYTCRIQTVDAGFAVSEWSEKEFNTESDLFQEMDFSISTRFSINAEWIDSDDNDSLELFIAGANDEGSFARTYPLINGEIDTGYTIIHQGHADQKAMIMDMNNDNILDYSYGFSLDSSFSIHIPGGRDTVLYPGITQGVFDWGDFDGDGDEDLVMTGISPNQNRISRIYKNNKGLLEEYSILLPGVFDGDIEWVDYDNDNDMDIAISGRIIGDTPLDLIPVTRIYQNHQGVFTNTEMDLQELSLSSMDFGDYDNDGDLDLLICGITDSSEIYTNIYRNDNGVFTRMRIELLPVIDGDCKWVDLNHDGYLDIVLTGNNDIYWRNGNYITKIYLWDKDNSVYTDAMTMEGFSEACISVGDYNRDAKTDLLIAGEYTNLSSNILLYKNIGEDYNHWPNPPEIINVFSYGDSARITWELGFDIETVGQGMTHNLRVGTTPGGSEIMSAKAGGRGFRKVIEKGNLGMNSELTIHGLEPGEDYFFAMQTIDESFYHSVFTTETKFNSNTSTLIKEDITFRDKNYLSADWVDYDDDADLDLMVTYLEGLNNITGIYPNNGSTIDTNFILITQHSFGLTKLPQLNDFNRDNSPDFSIPESDPAKNVSIYANNNGTYEPSAVLIPGLNNSMSAWGDLNNNGLEDYFIMGTDQTDTNLLTYIYDNMGLEFESLDNLIPGMHSGSIRWVDVDSDGDLDLFTCGITRVLNVQPEDYKVRLNINNGGAFAKRELSLPALHNSDVDFGDFDNDGDPDMVYSGISNIYPYNKTYICQNNEGNFIVIDSIDRVSYGKTRFADFNNDGYLDLIISGMKSTIPDDNPENLISNLYIYEDGRFVKSGDLAKFKLPVLAYGDYNKDGKLDLFMGGGAFPGETGALLYTNNGYQENTPPSMTSAPTATAGLDNLKLEWSVANDIETPVNGLSYNLRVGTTAGGNEIMSPLSHPDGTRKIVRTGNASQGFSYEVENLEQNTTYYYSIQAIDHAFCGSEWSAEKSITTLINGMDNIGSDLELSVYPNPSNGLFTMRLNLQKNSRVRVDLINQTGQIIKTILLEGKPGITESEILVNSQGMYTLRVQVGEKIYTERIIKL